MTKEKEKVERWVQTSVDYISGDMIAELMENKPDEWTEVTISDEDFYYALPMWSIMWSFRHSWDNDWLEEDGVEIMSKIGFRIFYSESYGYFFGIDGAGYDFYSSHWIPLYQAIFENTEKNITNKGEKENEILF